LTRSIVKERVPSDGRVIVSIGEQKRSISNTGVSVATYIGEEVLNPVATFSVPADSTSAREP
jgi:hypothetical protein